MVVSARTSSDLPESGTRQRTRAAILAAATSVLLERRDASMAEIALAAGVGRSTLHRHFTDRPQLLSALAEQVLDEIRQVVDELRLDPADPLDTLRQIVTGYFDLGPRLMILLNEPGSARGEEFWSRLAEADRPILQLLEAGQRSGVLNPAVSAAWLRRVLSWVVYAGVEAVEQGEMNRYDALAAVIQTLENGVRVAPRRP